MEIVASRYDRSGGNWSAPEQLTSNNQVDREPLPIVFGGSQGVLWIHNEGGEMIGTASLGDSLMYRGWTGSAWAAPVMLWSGKKGIQDFGFVADSAGEGHIVLSVDEDGDPDTAEDRNLYLISTTSGTWQAAVKITDDAVEDSLPVLVAPGGTPMLVWKAGSTMKYTSLSTWAPKDVYTEYTLANEAPSLDGVTLPGGAAIAYTVQSPEGQNIVAAFYDAALDQWSLPRQLTLDEHAETSLSMAFDGEQLLISYLKTQTLREDVEIEIDGEARVIENVPKPGRTDLYVLRHALGHDLAVASGSTSFDPGNPARGTQAQIKANIENRGDLPAQNVKVSVYDGDPNDGAAVIGVTTIVGPLVAGGSTSVTVSWDVPDDPNGHRVFVVVDPDLAFDDRDRSNNLNSAWTVLPDLVMESNRQDKVSESAVALTATLTNNGAIPTGLVKVCWRLNAEDGEEIGCTTVESIGTGAIREATLLWDTTAYRSKAGTVLVYAVGDPDSALIETDNSNNTALQGVWLPGVATVTTDGASSITQTRAVSGGNVTADGCDPVTARGVCWSTSANPTVADSKTEDGSGMGSYTSSITGLSPGTPYYVRAYATNSEGTSYGFDMPFTTLTLAPLVTTNPATSVSCTSATLNAKVNPNDLSTTVIFQYGLTTGYGTDVAGTPSPIAGTTDQSVIANIWGLTQGATYHFRVHATNAAGTSNGDDRAFIPSALAPIVTTDGADSITTISGRVKGTVNPNCLNTQYRFNYGLNTSYGSSTTFQSAGSGGEPVSVSATLNGLSSNMNYHYQIEALNTGGTRYGQDRTFDTLAPQNTVYISPSGNCGLKTPCYATLKEGIGAVADGGTVKIAEGVYEEGDIVNRGKTILLAGGWDSSFTGDGGEAILKGCLIGEAGTFIVDGVVVQ